MHLCLFSLKHFNCCYTSHSYCLIICTELNVFYISALGCLRTRSLTTLSAFQLHNEWSRLMKSSWCIEPYCNSPICFTAKWNDVFTDQLYTSKLQCWFTNLAAVTEMFLLEHNVVMYCTITGFRMNPILSFWFRINRLSKDDTPSLHA